MRVDLTDDPAVILIGARTELDEFAVVGRLHRLWSWADRQSRDGHVRGVTEKWIDAYVKRDGFAAAMREARWLSSDNDGVTFLEFSRHNGETAKKRALARDRQVTHRETHPSRGKRDKRVTREEKSNSPSLRSGESATRLPKDWLLPKAWGEWAMAEQPSWDAEQVRRVAAKFRDHWVAKAGKDGRKLDWEATWRNWVRNEGPVKAGVNTDTVKIVASCVGCGRKDKLMGSYGNRWYCAMPACKDKARDG